MYPRGRILLGPIIVLALVGAACSGPPNLADSEPRPGPPATPTVKPQPIELADVAAAFVTAWGAGEWDVLDELVFDPSVEAGKRHRETWNDLEVSDFTIEAGAIAEDGPRASQDLAVQLQLDGLGTWEFTTVLGLVMVGDRWWVEWAPAVIHPGLVDSRNIERRRVWPQRGIIRGWDGAPLRTQRPVTQVGIEPRRIVDRDGLLSELGLLLDVDALELGEALDAPGVQPDWFIPVATLRADEFPAVSLQLSDMAGVIVRTGFDRLAPTDDFAQQVLGTVGAITAEQLADWGKPYDATRVVGRSGLELIYESELAGTPGGDLRLVDRGGSLVSVLQTFAGRAAQDVTTGIDETIQAAAEAAVAGLADPVAVVAVDVPTGQIRAALSRPTNEFGRALSGAYPPGSTFKTITAAAFLDAGGAPTSPVACPAEVFVGGLRFRNAGGGGLGTVSLQNAYAASCNTAFVNAAITFDADTLGAMAAAFGFGLDYSVGINTGGGVIPAPIDDAEFAASSIGQGRVTASPLHMASVAAAVAGGAWQEPVLIIEPSRQRGFEPTGLDPEVIAGLQSMMRLVVTNGTGGAVARAGGDISGKTGSAEFGNEDPPETHAWFVGYRGDLAFAVLVEGGGSGGGVAAPIAAEFLALIDAG
jgi:cell division protein FtsI/penicillin-binding protein 2